MGVQALHPFPLPHASWRCMCHTSLPMHHVSWPRVAFASPTPKPHGGGQRPLGGAPRTPAAAQQLHDFLQAPTVMSSVPPKSNTNVPVAPEPPSLSQPLQGSSEGPSQRNPHSRANKKATSKTVTLADAVQKTVVLSHKVLRVDVNREHGQIPKVNETRLKLRPEDWPDNCMLLHVHLHVCRLCIVLGTNFLSLLPQ